MTEDQLRIIEACRLLCADFDAGRLTSCQLYDLLVEVGCPPPSATILVVVAEMHRS